MEQEKKRKNNLARNLMGAGMNVQLDNNIKRVLSNKWILATILKGVAEEVHDYDVEFIEKCIEGTPQISIVSVEPGMARYEPEDIAGNNTEDGIVGEGYIRYDLRFDVNLPKMKGTIKLLMNLEAQKKTNPGYPIVSRGIFYCCRMISSEYGVEFTSPEYGDIKKVYSIWICMNAEEDAIAVYDVRKRDLVAGIPDVKSDYDLLTVVQIWIRGENKEEKLLEKEKDYPVLGMLNTLLDPQLKAVDKIENLSEKYRIPMTYDLREAKSSPHQRARILLRKIRRMCRRCVI